MPTKFLEIQARRLWSSLHDPLSNLLTSYNMWKCLEWLPTWWIVLSVNLHVCPPTLSYLLTERLSLTWSLTTNMDHISCCTGALRMAINNVFQISQVIPFIPVNWQGACRIRSLEPVEAYFQVRGNHVLFSIATVIYFLFSFLNTLVR